ncbi:MAG: aminoacyl-tRNA hydrolase [Proteobacteria bacterium]|nr:aminoacyl-tRNA hydrolase [Pseudomonadota bacterium]
MLLFVGLGNPGPEHAGNRHNVGFMAADEIVRRHSFGPWRSRFHGRLSEGSLAGEKVLVLKPQTYMNESGRAVGEAVRFHRLAPSQVVVFHDELDLVAGKVRVKLGGGTAGHNGLRSLDAHIGPDFKRVRIGIGHPGDKRRVVDYVLRDFPKSARDWLAPLLEAIAEAAPLLARGDDAAFMSKVALLTRKQEPTPARAKGAHAKRREAPGEAEAAADEPAPSALGTALRTLLGRRRRRGDGGDGV